MRQASTLRGRRFSRSSTYLTSSAVAQAKPAPFGKYWHTATGGLVQAALPGVASGRKAESCPRPGGGGGRLLLSAVRVLHFRGELGLYNSW
ncbi:MAG: hypothetical protein OXD44_05520 [Gammaproteobacteria bacterium]|nr:hypothetical protein [Gammaproteobacteria bacterium]